MTIKITEQDFLLYDKEKDSIIKVTAKKVGNSWMAKCPDHEDDTPSLSIDEEKGLYHCFNPGCNYSGQLYVKNKIVAEYPYCDENNNTIYKTVRFGPKKAFAYMHLNEKGNWVFGAKDIKKIPYRLPELLNSDLNEPIIFVEGEKDVENLTKLGFTATTFHSTISWPKENNEYFINRKVVFIPDNDQAGIIFSSNIAKALDKVADVKWLPLQDLLEKEDVSDWIEKGGTAEELRKLIESAPDFKDVDINYSEEPQPQVNTKPKRSKDNKFDPREYTEIMLEKYHIKSDKFGKLWVYDPNEGIWKDNGEDYLKSELRKKYLTREHLKNYYVNEIIADIRQFKYEGKIFVEPPPYLIPFKDKIYDLKNDKLLDFSPDYFFVNKININIDTDNKACDLIDSVFTSFVGDDLKIELYELASYCLVRSYPYQKFFILTGQGSNGKSTYINILSMFIGSENVSSANIKDIFSNRFATSSLYKKLANVSVETDPFVMKNTAILKQLTGEDYIRAEEKFEKDFKFKNYAKIIIVTNKKLSTTDLTSGFGRRVKIINFIGSFKEGENADPFIMDKISSTELEGFAYLCLKTLKDLYKRGFVFTIEQDYEEVKKLYDERIQILNSFLEEKVTKDPESYIPTVEFFDSFNEHLIAMKTPLVTPYKLIDTMESMGYVKKVKNIMAESGWTTKAVWEGIRWN